MRRNPETFTSANQAMRGSLENEINEPKTGYIHLKSRNIGFGCSTVRQFIQCRDDGCGWDLLENAFIAFHATRWVVFERCNALRHDAASLIQTR